MKVHGEHLSGRLYHTWYVDPPWDYGAANHNPVIGVAKKYPTMDVEDIAGLLDKALDAHATPFGQVLWMWTTWPMVRNLTAHRLLELLGFTWKSELVWYKGPPACGHYFRKQTEILVLATRGNARLKKNRAKSDPTKQKFGVSDFPDFQETEHRGYFAQERGTARHSEKPWHFREVVEQWSEGPYIEVFARYDGQLAIPHGWAVAGNEAVGEEGLPLFPEWSADEPAGGRGADGDPARTDAQGSS